jgi:undecaprenyl pyrophosphate phosphatase UppP
VDELGKHFWLKTVGLVIGLGILGLISMLIFTGLIARFGAIAALIIIFGIFMLIAYRSDKKKQREWDELDAKADASSS